MVLFYDKILLYALGLRLFCNGNVIISSRKWNF